MHHKFFPVILSLLYVLAALGLFFYSYTQVDLNLTLTSTSVLQRIQSALMGIGYFERPLSALVYTSLIVFLFLLYGITIYAAAKKIITLRHIISIIALVATVLALSYPAFSYDFFNYLFTAKTVLFYHKNPYEVIPLQFISMDPWILFMRWSHTVSAYSPLWIGLSLVPFALGFGYFLAILWSMKVFFVLVYLLTCAGIFQLAKTLKHKNPELSLVVFALSPLVIIETVVSSHNDSVMMLLFVWAIVWYERGQYIKSWVLYALSIALKTMTIAVLPLIFFPRLPSRYLLGLGALSAALFAVVVSREILPWYFLWLMPIVAIVASNWPILIIASGTSLGLLLRYVPYLYTGNWNPPVREINDWTTVIFFALSVLVGVIVKFKNRAYR